jgi:hypothetical protein
MQRSHLPERLVLNSCDDGNPCTVDTCMHLAARSIRLQARNIVLGWQHRCDKIVSLANMRYYISAFKRVRPEDEVKQPVLRTAIEDTVEHEGGTHFEALLGSG